MAVKHGYGSTVSSNLIFAYDTGDTRNSYIGEPTTNICNNADFSTAISGTAGGSFGGWTFGSWDSSNTHQTVTDTYDGQSINALKITLGSYPAHFFSSNWGTETIPGRTYTWTNLLKGSPGQVVQMYSHWGNLLTVTLTGEWQEFSTTFVRGGSVGQYMYYNPSHTAAGNVIYVARVQVEEKSHKTPFTVSSRSNTQGLLDLTGISSINLSGVSFNANAGIEFDGSNDNFKIDVNSIIRSYTAVTFESIHRDLTGTGGATPYSLMTSPNSDGNADGFWHHYVLGGRWYWRLEDSVNGEVGNIFDGATPFQTGSWYHVVAVVKSNTILYYINGNLVQTVNTNFAWANLRTDHTAYLYLGSGYGDNYYFGGNLPVFKMYNRELNSTEISANYKHYKTRFGLS